MDHESAEAVGQSVGKTLSRENFKECGKTCWTIVQDRCSRLVALFRQHPTEQGTTYGQHFLRASTMACQMAKGSTVLFIHAVFPFWFQSTGSDTINELHTEIHATKRKLE
jgi:hypothetical protein